MPHFGHDVVNDAAISPGASDTCRSIQNSCRPMGSPRRRGATASRTRTRGSCRADRANSFVISSRSAVNSGSVRKESNDFADLTDRLDLSTEKVPRS